SLPSAAHRFPTRRSSDRVGGSRPGRDTCVAVSTGPDQARRAWSAPAVSPRNHSSRGGLRSCAFSSSVSFVRASLTRRATTLALLYASNFLAYPTSVRRGRLGRLPSRAAHPSVLALV